MKFALAWLGLAAAPGCVSAGLLRRAANVTQADAAAAAAKLGALESEAIRELNEAYGMNADSEEYAGYDVDQDEKAAKEMVKKTGDEKSGTYGEVQPDGVAAMLRAVGAKPGMRYYDLGSGTGKTVALAWLLGLDATGVELSDVRYRASCKALASLPEQPPIKADGQRQGLRFKLENIEKTDFSDADIIFANSVLLTNHTLEILADRARTMKVGAKLITYKGLPGSGFRTDGKVTVPCSWFPVVPYVVQTVVAPMQAVSFAQVGRKAVRRHKLAAADVDDEADDVAEEDGEEEEEGDISEEGDGAEEGDEEGDGAEEGDEAVDADSEGAEDADEAGDEEAETYGEANSEEEPSAEDAPPYEEPAAQEPAVLATMVCEK